MVVRKENYKFDLGVKGLMENGSNRNLFLHLPSSQCKLDKSFSGFQDYGVSVGMGIKCFLSPTHDNHH